MSNNAELHFLPHCSDVIMSAMVSQITGDSIVYSAFCLGAHQRKHQSSASLAFVRGNPLVTGGFTSQRFKIQDSKAFIRQCTDINHIKQWNNVKKTNQNISWWVHVWRPSLRPYGRYHKGHQKMASNAKMFPFDDVIMQIFEVET